MELLCNSCWEPIDPRQEALATACDHLLCAGCGDAHLRGGDAAACAVCAAPLREGDAARVRALLPAAEARLLLAGLAPEAALAAAEGAVRFAAAQQAQYAAARAGQAAQRYAKLADSAKRKIEEVHKGYRAAKAKYDQERRARGEAQAAAAELAAKYDAKAKEAAHLRQALPALQREVAELRHAAGATRHSPAPAAHGGGAYGAPHGGGYAPPPLQQQRGGTPALSALGARGPPPAPSPFVSPRFAAGGGFELGIGVPGAGFGPGGGGGGGGGHSPAHRFRTPPGVLHGGAPMHTLAPAPRGYGGGPPPAPAWQGGAGAGGAGAGARPAPPLAAPVFGNRAPGGGYGTPRYSTGSLG
jgi:hypothetical protein